MRIQPKVLAGMLFLAVLLPQDLVAGSVRPVGSDGRGGGVVPVLFSSAIVQKLQNDAFALEKTVNTYLSVARSLDSDLKLVISGLNMVDKVAGDIADFDKALGEVQSLLGVAKLIPPIESEATALYDAIGATKPSVDEISRTVNNINDELKPAREAIEAFESKLSQAISEIEKLEADLDSYVQHLVNAQTCVNDLPAGTVRDGMQRVLDDLAGPSDVTVVDANTVLTDILVDLGTIRSIIDGELKAVFDGIGKIEADLEITLHDVDILIYPLKELGVLWNKKFSITFPYPNPDWKNPLRIGHYSLKIGFSVIIKGIHEIEKEIKRLLKKALYEAAKVFGLEKLAKQLIRDAEAELNKIRGGMKLKIDIKVPGLDKLESEMRAIQAAYERMKKALEKDAQPFLDAMAKLRQDEQALEKIYSDCRKAL